MPRRVQKGIPLKHLLFDSSFLSTSLSEISVTHIADSAARLRRRKSRICGILGLQTGKKKKNDRTKRTKKGAIVPAPAVGCENDDATVTIVLDNRWRWNFHVWDFERSRARRKSEGSKNLVLPFGDAPECMDIFKSLDGLRGDLTFLNRLNSFKISFDFEVSVVHL